MPRDTKTLYALEGHAGATSLYHDAERRRFAMTRFQSIPEGELIEDSWANRYVVTWAQPERIAYVHEDRKALEARYNARVAAGLRKAA